MNALLKIATLITASLSLTLTGCGGKIESHQGVVDIPDSRKKLDHLVILEVFYIGSWQDEYEYEYTDGGETYKMKRPAMPYPLNDAYIKIHNPTSELIYLDGLALVTSEIDPTEQFTFKDPNEDFTKDFMGVTRIAMFAGKGTEHPIGPGETLLIVASAGNHRLERVEDEETGQVRPGNPLSFDFSNADWEWLPEGYANENDFTFLPDNPEVPNMVLVYSEQNKKLNYGPFNIDQDADRMGIALVDLHAEDPSNPEAVRNKLKNEDKTSGEYYWKDYTATLVSTNSYTKKDYCIGLPKEWCIDAVIIAPTQQYLWNPFPKELDSGSSGVTLVHKSGNSYSKEELGQAIRRQNDGLKFVDDNNSSSDFTKVKASAERH